MKSAAKITSDKKCRPIITRIPDPIRQSTTNPAPSHSRPEGPSRGASK